MKILLDKNFEIELQKININRDLTLSDFILDLKVLHITPIELKKSILIKRRKTYNLKVKSTFITRDYSLKSTMLKRKKKNE